MQKKLLDLQERINSRNIENEFHEYIPRLFFSKVGEFYEVVFYGEGYDNDPEEPISKFDEDDATYAFCATQEFLIEHASQIVSVRFEGPDCGANGTNNLNFSRLANANVMFENLKYFSAQLMHVGDHNHVIIGEEFDEDGMIAKLVSKMPNLSFLQMPSAPNKDFFELPNLQIRELIIQAGYDHQDFIENLADASNLPKLCSLDFFNPYEYDAGGKITSLESYKKLFVSKIFSKGFHFKLRENRLKKSELQELNKFANIQFLHIKTEVGEYVE